MKNDKYSWFLIFAIVMEIAAAMLLGLSDGMTKLFPTLLALIGYVGSYYLLTLSLKRIPIGLAYALWAGIGIMVTSLLNLFMTGAALHPGSTGGMLLIVAGVLVINLLAKNEIHESSSAVENTK